MLHSFPQIKIIFLPKTPATGWWNYLKLLGQVYKEAGEVCAHKNQSKLSRDANHQGCRHTDGYSMDTRGMKRGIRATL